MTNQQKEDLKKASNLVENFCEEYDDCTGCKLNPICEILPLKLNEVLKRLAEN